MFNHFNYKPYFPVEGSFTDKPTYLGPPVLIEGVNGTKAVGQAIDNRITCMVRRADGSVGHGPCGGLQAAVVPQATAATVLPVSGSIEVQAETNWPLLIAIGLGVYLLAKK